MIALAAAGKGDDHFNAVLNIPNNWALYAGLNSGFIAYVDEDHDDDHNHYDHTSGVDLGLQIGARYDRSAWGTNLGFGAGNNLSGAGSGPGKKFWFLPFFFL